MLQHLMALIHRVGAMPINTFANKKSFGEGIFSRSSVGTRGTSDVLETSDVGLPTKEPHPIDFKAESLQITIQKL